MSMAESYSNANPFERDGTPYDTGMGDQMQSSTIDSHETAESAFQNAERGASEGLHKVRDTANRAGDRVKSSLAQASNYVKTMDASDMWGDVKELARRNPGASILTVAVLGFALGRTTFRKPR